MIVCWEGLSATAIEEGDSTAPVSDKPTIRELAAGPERTGRVGAIYLASLVTRSGLATARERK